MATIQITYQYPDQPVQKVTVNLTNIMAEVMLDDLKAMGAVASFVIIKS